MKSIQEKSKTIKKGGIKECVKEKSDFVLLSLLGKRKMEAYALFKFETTE